MKNALGIVFALLALLGCGENTPISLDDPANFIHHGDVDALKSSCKKPFTVSMIETKVIGYSPSIKFIPKMSEPITVGSLNKHARFEEHCAEIENHLSGALIKDGANIIPNSLSIEISFETTAEQDEKMLLGKAANLRPEDTIFTFIDGTLKDSFTHLKLRCPGSASVTCQISEVGDYKTCESYNVSYSDHCTFRGTVLVFNFSDHRTANLDVEGELRLSPGNAQLKFTEISWMGLD
jgi:hypothetical protein